MRRLFDLVPNVETLLELEAPELAGVILEQLNSAGPGDAHQLNLPAYSAEASAYPQERRDVITARLAEGWAWLIANGMLAPRVDYFSGSWCFVTRLGQRTADRAGLAQYLKAMELPKDKLHPSIADRCHAQFIRGEFDTAVFQAYKQLEIAIREAAGLPDGLIGVALARKAFNVDDGPLTDMSREPSERQALSDLMAGALGSYKNPHSHRNVRVYPAEAADMIIMASHLLGIVELRSMLAR
jgi:uncharacterized protein (TIGR02391 family)